MTNKKIAFYVHWPFCKSKCPYCDFNSHVRDKVEYDKWLTAYLKEIEYFTTQIPNSEVVSIFFGGGTPSLMPANIVSSIIEKIANHYLLSKDIEITLEANPTSVEITKLKEFKLAGINRVSLGIQALNEHDLKFLGREHSKDEAIRAIEYAREIFPRYSFDLIYARPGQTANDWEKELNYALSLINDHISLYQLTIEKGTPFYSQYHNKQFAIPKDDEAFKLYELTQEILEGNGLPAYEISNHATPGEECKHNMVYWRYDDYVGIGPGAHSRINKQAIMMIHHPENWLNKVLTENVGIQQQTSLSDQEMLYELLIMGMRIKEGITRTKFQELFNAEPESLLSVGAIDILTKEGLIQLDNNRLFATKAGFLVLNKVIELLLPN